MQFMKKSASRLDLLNKDHRLRKILLLSLKIGVGSSLAIYLARRMALDYAVSAGTIIDADSYDIQVGIPSPGVASSVNLSADSGFSVGMLYLDRKSVDCIWGTVGSDCLYYGMFRLEINHIRKCSNCGTFIFQ